MYSIDLTRISLDEFAVILANTELLPSRRMLAEQLPAVMAGLRQKGIAHVAALQQLLKDKTHYPPLAQALGVTPEYLTLLSREVNSYVSKPVAIAALGLFADAEVGRLAGAGLKSTKDLFAACLTPAARRALAERVQLGESQVVAALEMADLLRITGVGPVYARLLRQMGLCHAAAFAAADAHDLLARYEALTAGQGLPKLSLKDVEYCQRFSRLLEHTIEW